MPNDKIREIVKEAMTEAIREAINAVENNQDTPYKKLKDIQDQALSLIQAEWQKRIEEMKRELVERDEIFIKHIQNHLPKGQEVICKICGKTAKEIINEI